MAWNGAFTSDARGDRVGVTVQPSEEEGRRLRNLESHAWGRAQAGGTADT